MVAHSVRKKIRQIRQQKAAEQNYRCYHCDRLMVEGGDIRWTPTADHLHPLSKGGARTDPNNIVAACYDCNTKRGNAIYAECGRPTTDAVRDFLQGHTSSGCKFCEQHVPLRAGYGSP